MQLMSVLGTQLLEELHAAYRPVLHALMELEEEFPNVARNQAAFSATDLYTMDNAQATLLYSMQGSVPEETRRTRRQIRDALATLQVVPGMEAVVVAWLIDSFSATIYMVEHLFFLNREIARRLHEEPRVAPLHGKTVENAVYPTARVDTIVAQAYAIWKGDYVFQDPG